MRFSTRPRWTKPSSLALCAALAGGASLAAERSPADGTAPGLHDLHLHILPRTEDETKRIAAVTAWTQDFSAPEQFEELPAGAATVRPLRSAEAFSQPSGNMEFDRELEFKVGNGLFRKLWVSSPSSTRASDGLGPLYNARGCQNCHLKDGRASASM